MRKQKEWQRIALHLARETKLSYVEITEHLNNIFEFNVKYDTVKKYIWMHLNDDLAEEEKQARECGFIEQKEKPEFLKKKLNIVCNQEPETFDKGWDGAQTVKFAVMGDTQFGSKYAQISHLKRFYDICAELGIKDVYHTGDITDGLKMRNGHEYELYVTSADEMVEDVIANYPFIPGIKTHFITGNHDASIYKHVGYDIGPAIADKRFDMEYLGRDCAVVNITPNCTMEMRHPWDGTAYAISYKPQKMIESMEADSKPSILAIGHYHKAEYLFYRNVHCLQTGCFQSQTPFTRGKGISVWMGGWIVTVRLDEQGHILGFAPEFIPFYAPIKDDYKKYRLY